MSTDKDDGSWTEITLSDEVTQQVPTDAPKGKEPVEVPLETETRSENLQVEVESESAPPVQEPAATVESPKKPSRLDRRIGDLTRKLATQEEVFKAREAELLRQVEEARTAATQSQTKGLEVAKKALEDRLAAAKGKLRNAHESGDSAALAEANAEMAMAASELAVVGTMVPRAQSPAPKEVPKQPAHPELPEAAMEWLGANSWYARGPKQDRVAAAAAAAIGDDLVAEGWDLADPSYYEELDRRLKEEIPERMKKLRPDPTPTPVPTRSQRAPVVGTSRSASPTPAGSRPNTVRLSAEEVAIANRMGISLKEFALEKLKVERAAVESNGYTVIE